MSNVNKKIIWILSILSFIGILICYPSLPEKVPMHWNLRWEIDGLGSKNYLLFLGFIPILLIIFSDSIIKYRHGNENSKQNKVYQLLNGAVILLIIFINWLSIMVAFGVQIKVSLLLPVILGIFFIVIGNYMPVLRTNFYLGIRNPWTLSDDFIWRKTHKMGGYLFIILGVLMIFMSIIQNTVVSVAVFTILILSVIGINVYSYILFKKQKGN